MRTPVSPAAPAAVKPPGATRAETSPEVTLIATAEALDAEMA